MACGDEGIDFDPESDFDPDKSSPPRTLNITPSWAAAAPR